MKTADWVAIFIPLIFVNITAWWGGDNRSIAYIVISTGILVAWLLFCIKRLTEKHPLEFWNGVETRTTKNVNEIRNVLYFTNNTKEKIPVEGYHFRVFKKGRDKLLIATNDFHISGAVIEPSAVKQPITYSWFDPMEWHIEGKGTYQIICKVIYSYKDDTKTLTSVYSLEWDGVKLEKEKIG